MKSFLIKALIILAVTLGVYGCIYVVSNNDEHIAGEETTDIDETTTDENVTETTTVHHHRWEKTCGKSSVCIDCGEDDGIVLNHTIELGLCDRCNQELRKQSPITIIDRTYDMDYVGGVQWTFKIRNNTDKQIKYITLQWHCYNAVGDYVYDDIDGKNYVRVKFTGPLDAYSTSNTTRNSTKFYDYNFNSSKLTEIIVEYMDGTTETVTKYHDNISE